MIIKISLVSDCSLIASLNLPDVDNLILFSKEIDGEKSLAQRLSLTGNYTQDVLTGSTNRKFHISAHGEVHESSASQFALLYLTKTLIKPQSPAHDACLF